MLLIGYGGSYCKGFLTTEEFEKLGFDPERGVFANTAALQETVEYCKGTFALTGKVWAQAAGMTEDDKVQIQKARKEGDFAGKLVIASSAWDGIECEQQSVLEYSLPDGMLMLFFRTSSPGDAFFFEAMAPRGTRFYAVGSEVYVSTIATGKPGQILYKAIEAGLSPVRYSVFCVAIEHGRLIHSK